VEFFETELDNGLKVIAEVNPAVHSVAASYFVRTGARDETDTVSGVSHFLEHMAFKGNDKYTADDVNRIFDELGARYNASTSEEVTLYYAAVLPEYLSKTFELLSTLIQPSLHDEDFEIEKKVILEEIGMYEDQPGFTVYDKTMATHFAGHPLGRSILGTTQSITDLTAVQMREYHATQYRAGNVTLAVAGNTTWDEVLSLANTWCSHWPSGATERLLDEARPTGSVELLTRESSVQQHIMSMSPAPSARDPLRYAAQILALIIGDDSGSRMFWDLVDPGDAEAAELGFNEYEGSGTWLTYLSCQPEDAESNLERIRRLYAEVNHSGVTADELETAKNKAASRIVLRSERPMGRLSSLGGNWVYLNSYRSVKADLDAVNEVTREDICKVTEKYPLDVLTTVGIGPLTTLALT
jgi:predicted Zn-dependent peptidase